MLAFLRVKPSVRDVTYAHTIKAILDTFHHPIPGRLPAEQDVGSIERRTEVALLNRLSEDFSFPCRDDPSLVLPVLTEHLKLTLSKENPRAWEAVSSFFKRAQPWAVRISV